MHRLLTLLFVFSLAIPGWAADDTKPNTLTPKEIVEGWILLFDGETTFGWDADCRLKKGPISLQGHDPTTDLSLRNIRIADLSGKD
jgi:hypothetical protein